jgi:NAD-dependent deacetylase
MVNFLSSVMKKLIILTGAGVSAESGIITFREMGGLWDKYSIEEVASPQAWKKNPQLVLDFYNTRRKQLLDSQPNAAHRALVDLERKYEVHIVTQNVDDLHERAGSTKVLHLHGELMKVRSEKNEKLISTLNGWELKLGDKAEDGEQLRPHIVWFGEAVPMINNAAKLVKSADIMIIIGTSLSVYPAAGLLFEASKSCLKYYIDPIAETQFLPGIELISKKATEGVPHLVEQLFK